MPRAPRPGRNATAERAIDLLLVFDEQHPVQSAAQVARRLGMSRSTTYRYLQSLRSHGLLEMDVRRGTYRLGNRIIQLASIARNGLTPPEPVFPLVRTPIPAPTAVLRQPEPAL